LLFQGATFIDDVSVYKGNNMCESNVISYGCLLSLTLRIRYGNDTLLSYKHS